MHFLSNGESRKLKSCVSKDLGLKGALCPSLPPCTSWRLTSTRPVECSVEERLLSCQDFHRLIYSRVASQGVDHRQEAPGDRGTGTRES